MKGVFGGIKGCRQHNRLFGVKMRYFGYEVKGVFGGRKGVFEAKGVFDTKMSVWGRKGVFGSVMGSESEGLF